MDAPIFGDESKGIRYAVYVVLALVTGFALSAVAIGIIIGLQKDFGLVVTGIVVALSLVNFGLMFKWYFSEALEPRYKILIVLLLLLVVVMSANTYIIAFNVHGPSYDCLGNQSNPEVKKTYFMMTVPSKKDPKVREPKCFPFNLPCIGGDGKLKSGTCLLNPRGLKTAGVCGSISTNYTANPGYKACTASGPYVPRPVAPLPVAPRAPFNPTIADYLPQPIVNPSASLE